MEKDLPCLLWLAKQYCVRLGVFTGGRMTLFLHAVLWLFIGLFIGASLGVVIAGLCAAAGREPERGWIPVSERLPETNKDVLVLTRFGTCEVAGKYPNGWVAATVAVWKTVTHWMPLPLPPEADDE
jgi:hypothetical protein